MPERARCSPAASEPRIWCRSSRLSGSSVLLVAHIQLCGGEPSVSVLRRSLCEYPPFFEQVAAYFFGDVAALQNNLGLPQRLKSHLEAATSAKHRSSLSRVAAVSGAAAVALAAAATLAPAAVASPGLCEPAGRVGVLHQVSRPGWYLAQHGLSASRGPRVQAVLRPPLPPPVCHRRRRPRPRHLMPPPPSPSPPPQHPRRPRRPPSRSHAFEAIDAEPNR